MPIKRACVHSGWLRRWHEATGHYRSRSRRRQLTVYDVGLRPRCECSARPVGSHPKYLLIYKRQFLDMPAGAGPRDYEPPVRLRFIDVGPGRDGGRGHDLLAERSLLPACPSSRHDLKEVAVNRLRRTLPICVRYVPIDGFWQRRTKQHFQLFPNGRSLTTIRDHSH
jgi:hypothetical protein